MKISERPIPFIFGQKGLQLVESLGCSPIAIETDSMELFQAFNVIIEVWSPYAAVLAEQMVWRTN
jgi:hypothetical protein